MFESLPHLDFKISFNDPRSKVKVTYLFSKADFKTIDDGDTLQKIGAHWEIEKIDKKINDKNGLESINFQEKERIKNQIVEMSCKYQVLST